MDKVTQDRQAGLWKALEGFGQTMDRQGFAQNHVHLRDAPNARAELESRLGHPSSIERSHGEHGQFQNQSAEILLRLHAHVRKLVWVDACTGLPCFEAQQSIGA